MGMVLYSIGVVIKVILNCLMVLIAAAVIVSWVGDPNNPIVRTINSVATPLLKPLKPLTRKIPGDLDWTPVVALIIIYILYQILVPIFMSGAFLR